MARSERTDRELAAAAGHAADVDRLLAARAAQGFPATVEDPVALRKVAVLVETPVRSAQVSS